MQNFQKVSGKISKYTGKGGWHYFLLDEKLSSQLKSHSVFGMVPITVTLRNTTWKTSLMMKRMDGKESRFFIALNGKVRKQYHLNAGDSITLSFAVEDQ